MSTIVMPRLSDTMEEGTILRWLKGEGEEIARGEELVEIETDKATMTYESDLAGTLHLLAAEGDTLAVGQPIATVGDRDDENRARPGSSTVPSGVAPSAGDPLATGTAAGGDRPGAAAAQAAGGEDRPADRAAQAAGAQHGDGGPPGAHTPAGAGERVKASPLARRIAREAGVDLGTVAGSGPGGRIVKADVLGPGRPGSAGTAPLAPESAEGISEAARAISAVATAKGETSEVELSKTQQTVARRMAESKATIPDFTLQAAVDMEACVTLRSELKRLASGAAEDVPTYNDMVVKACALALREHPLANGSYRDGRLQLYSRVNVGVAVAAQDSLVVPTVFDADTKALGEIAREARALAAKVRDGSITPPELGGGTFTVSNLGMFGIDSFAAIINPPQAAIMAVGALAQRAVVREGQLTARHTMSATLVCDHRILYGAPAAEFLARVRELLEAPSSLTL